jgi:hypothetical protein
MFPNFVAMLHLHQKLEAYIDTTIAAYATLTDADAVAVFEKLNAQGEGRMLTPHWQAVRDYLSLGYYFDPNGYSSNFQVVKSPLITTNWRQTAPYNNYINYALYLEGKTTKNFMAGCIPVALAQLVTYYQYMQPITPTIAPFNQPTINSWDPKVGVWTGQYNWTAMKNVSTLTVSNTSMVGQIGVLLHQLSKILNVEYIENLYGEYYAGANVTFTNGHADGRKIIETLVAMGYKVEDWDFKYVTNENNTAAYQTTRKNNLAQGHPYLVVGIDEDGRGHGWLVDGYGTMTQYSERLLHLNRDPIIVNVTINDRMMVHCNMGNSVGNG